MLKCNFTAIVFVVVKRIDHSPNSKQNNNNNVILYGSFGWVFLFFGNLLHSKLKKNNSYKRGIQKLLDPQGLSNACLDFRVYELIFTGATWPMMIILKYRTPITPSSWQDVDNPIRSNATVIVSSILKWISNTIT